MTTKSNKAIKYRLYPTKEQQTMFAKTFGCVRKVWNLMLADRQHGNIYTPAHYKDEYPYLKEVDSLALANAQMHLNTAYKNCYEDGNANPPKFKSRHRSKRTYTTNCKITEMYPPTIRIGENYIHLPKVGNVPAVIHKKPDEDWKLKSVTVSQNAADEYYASVLYEYEQPEVIHLAPADDMKALGLDYKSDGLYMDSEGECANMPKFFRETEGKIRKAEHVLSRRVGSRKGEAASHNHEKQRQRVAKLYNHASNQRKDYLHKRSTQIANEYDVVCIENLDMRAMSNKSFGNGKATLDNGYGMFQQMLAYKLAGRGKYLVKVSRWYPSSQLCHNCGYRQKMPLNVRTYRCPVCGMVYDRDANAAINIRDEGIRILRESLA